ncbi:hypothetical protein BB31_35125 [Amycolatopsis lurida NRRL 2430]|uniref:Uncharacterized protein n=1 Tax=Amycolatopsis lurida NRRL 2430 TaxID=1460371 RepID=A0A2P2FIW0_AMYLU|nr:hypothetical protein BB31_35125 [Amycolatopsis lurida NRRL 2430]
MNTRRVQGFIELAEGLGRQVALGVAEVHLGCELGEAVGSVGSHRAVECGECGYLAGVGRGGARRQEAADAVAGRRNRSGADLGLCGEEPEIGVGVAQDTFCRVRLDQGHQLSEDRGPDLFSDVLGKFYHRCSAVSVEEVGDQHVVPVPSQFASHLPQHGPDPEAVGVHQHPWVPTATVGDAGERVGLAVRGGNLQHLGGHEFSCRG